jgi:hypothetical protein
LREKLVKIGARIVRHGQPVDAAQDLGEQRPRHSDFGQVRTSRSAT